MKKKQTKKDKLRQWGLPESFQWHHLRYKQPYQKGILWFWFSLAIRKRDVEKWGRCISCDKPITIENSQAGHFCPASSCGRDLLFDELNVNAECPRCNAWDEGHLIGYRNGLVRRYGENEVLSLEHDYLAYRKSKTPVKDFTAAEYEEMIREISQ